ncbi:MAG TPA: NAD(P)-dependent oxidoreductase [Opitutaceae bacterium]|nr:NAD(P)-dependent oxidoreductase [Opitutaceae bacterium]
MKRILVTGGSGKAGQWVVREFLAAGYDVVNVDSRRPAPELPCRTIAADLTQLGQVVSAFSPHVTGRREPYAGVVHLAAIPRPFDHPNDEVFRTNVLATHHVLEACGLLGIRKAVIASSESSYGMAFSHELLPPVYLPIDEDHPQRPEDTYGLSKVLNEQTAEMFHRRDGLQALSFRIGNVITPEDYAPLRARLKHPEDRQRILWSYIDARDLAAACRLGIEKDGLGCRAMNVTADVTSSDIPTPELLKRFFPGVPLKSPLPGHRSLYTNTRLKELLDWRQRHFLVEAS